MDQRSLGKQLESAVVSCGGDLDEQAKSHFSRFDLEGRSNLLSYSSLVVGLVAGDLAARRCFGVDNPKELKGPSGFELPLDSYVRLFGPYLGRCVFDWGFHDKENPLSHEYIENFDNAVLLSSCRHLLVEDRGYQLQFSAALRRVLTTDCSSLLRLTLSVFLEVWERRVIARPVTKNYYRLFCAFRSSCASALSVDVMQLASGSGATLCDSQANIGKQKAKNRQRRSVIDRCEQLIESKPSLAFCTSKEELVYSISALSTSGCGQAMSSSSTAHGTATLFKNYLPKTKKARFLLYLERGKNVFVRLDDFIADSECFGVPDVEIVGDKIRYVGSFNRKILRETDFNAQCIANQRSLPPTPPPSPNDP